jgi:hypothetical protein
MPLWAYMLVFLPVTFFAVLMCAKVLPYLSFERMVHFLSTKTNETLDNPVFRKGFYVHIISSAVVLLSGIPQFSTFVIHRWPGVHRWSGMVYVLGLLALAAPSGLVLAWYANGGLPAKTGFGLQCIVWWLCTWMAYRKILQEDYRAHIVWMIRSFAVTLAALSLRSETYALHYFFHTKPIETYVTITWISWTGNLLIAEFLINLGLDKYLLKQYKTYKE